MVELSPAVLEKCRLCLNNLGQLKIRDNFGLQQDIYTYLLIKVSIFDDLPQSICEECYRKLNNIKNLKEIAKNSDVHLKLLLLREKVNCEQNENSLKIKIRRIGDDYCSEYCIEPQTKNEVDQNSEMRLRDIVAKAYFGTDDTNNTGTPNTEDENSWLSQQNGKEPVEILIDTDSETEPNGDDISEKSSISDYKFKREDKVEYICDNCSKRCTTRRKLCNHMRSHDKKFVCAKRGCGKRFACKNDLTKHIRVHTGSKPYHCEMCDVRFTQMVGLRLHFKAMHQKDVKIK